MPDNPKPKQLDFSEAEQQRLRLLIEENFEGSRANNEARTRRFRRYFQMWRGLATTPTTAKDGTDFQVPMLKWITLGQLARMVAAVFGEDSEIVAEASAPSGEKSAAKAGRYMTWRVFDYMKAIRPIAVWLFRGILNGRGHAELLYEQDFFWERRTVTDDQIDDIGQQGLRYEVVDDDRVDVEVIKYDGPKVRPLHPSQIFLPSQDNVLSDEDHEWVLIRDQITPQMLLDGEARGKYQNITLNWERIIGQAQQRNTRDYRIDEELTDVDLAEGVQRETTLGSRDCLDVWRWYGKWRMLSSKRDARADNPNPKYRNPNQSDLIVTYLPQVQIIIGIQDARDVYPKIARRHPLFSIAPIKDGSYWSPGLGEMVEDLQTEGTVNHALMRKAGMFTVGPLVFFKPSSGFDPDTFVYSPGQAIPSEDPNGVKVVNMQSDLSYTEKMSQALAGIAERVTGVSDQTLGRVSDRPNTPQTASGQAMLIQEGNTRVELDIRMLREDLGEFVNGVWKLDAEYAPEEVFFRATDEDAGGLFDTDNGFGNMTAEEREQPMNFSLKFATSYYSKEAKKTAFISLYNVSILNPIVQTNPRALWTLLNRLWEAFGEKNFRDIIPEPPETDRPKMPQEEWALMLKGEVVNVNPMDDDDAHLNDHRKRLQTEMQQDPERRDHQLEGMMTSHIMAHQLQKRQKAMMQELASQAIQAMAAQGVDINQLMGAGGQPGAPGAPGAQPQPGQAQPPKPPAPQPNGPQGNIRPMGQAQ